MTNTQKYLFYIFSIAIILRSIHIFSPLIGDNSWRQTDTAAMARNFYENGFNFFYPQIDWGGNSEGYVETEFPAYPFLVSLLYKLLGVHDSIGRLLSVIFSLITIWLTFQIVKTVIDETSALWTCFFLALLPFNVYYSRNFFPEPMLILCIVSGIYFFIKWIRSDKSIDFLLSAIFIAFACLLKIPTLYIGLPLAYLSYQKYGRSFYAQKKLYLFAMIVIIPTAFWYYHAHTIFKETGLTFGIWEYGSDKWGNWALVSSWNFWNSILFRNLAEKHLTWFGFPILVWGLFIHRKTKLESLFDFWLIAFVIYFIIVAKGNYVHTHYQLPFIIPCSVFMGKVYSKYFTHNSEKRKIYVFLAFSLIGIITLSGWRLFSITGKENTVNSPEYELASMINQKTPDTSRIVVVDGNDPTILYLSHRKGWHAGPSDFTNDVLGPRASNGSLYVAGMFKYFNDAQYKQLMHLIDSGDVIWKDERSFIIRMRFQNNQ